MKNLKNKAEVCWWAFRETGNPHFYTRAKKIERQIRKINLSLSRSEERR
jgi:hypothetical protein